MQFLSLTEFAEIIGVAPSTLAGYALPEPDVMIGNTRGWTRLTVDAWQRARVNRKGPGPKPAEVVSGK